jgi:hypothetical protein
MNTTTCAKKKRRRNVDSGYAPNISRLPRSDIVAISLCRIPSVLSTLVWIQLVLQAKEVSALQCEKFEHSEIGMITGSEKTPGTDDE